MLRIKSGVYSPEPEVDIVRAIAEKLPEADIRIDASGSWSISHAPQISKALNGVRIEYFEDPVGYEGL